MSQSSDNDLNLDLLFLPAWAQESPAENRFAHYREEESDRGERRRGRPGERPRREAAGRPGRGEAGQRREGRRPPRDDKGRAGRGPRRDERTERGERREPPAPLPELKVAFVPDEKGVESLARQIKMNGRAYPLFDIARMILQKPERHAATFSVTKKADGSVAQPLFVCALDDTLWLSEEEAVAHVLGRHFDTFYQTEKTAAEAPKGTYTFVAQCGMSGEILGPPNYHNYQTRLHKLHAERFSRMPFEVFKSRVKIVRDEAVVKQWIEEQSWKTEFIALNVPEAIRFGSRDEVEQHFRATHLPAIIKQVEEHTVSGLATRSLRGPMARLYRLALEDQRRFPLQIATALSQQFAGHGLQFFKVNKTITHVSVARPHYLDMTATPVSEGVKRIVSFIDATPKCTRRRLLESLAPSTPAPASNGAVTPAAAPPAEAGQPATPAPEPEPTPEQTAVITDLHWLIHQGHVIEFATGILETAKKPAPKTPRPAPKSQSPSAAKPEEASGESAPTEPQDTPSEEPAAISGESTETSTPEQADQAGETTTEAVEKSGDATEETTDDVPEPKPQS